VNLRGVLLVWIGLMGLAASAVSFVLLRLFPSAFSVAGPAFVWPWQASSSGSARTRGWLLFAAAIMSILVAVVGIASLLS
jgi:hypothetical protein